MKVARFERQRVTNLVSHMDDQTSVFKNQRPNYIEYSIRLPNRSYSKFYDEMISTARKLMLISVQLTIEEGVSKRTSISNISTVGAASRRFIVRRIQHIRHKYTASLAC